MRKGTDSDEILSNKDGDDWTGNLVKGRLDYKIYMRQSWGLKQTMMLKPKKKMKGRKKKIWKQSLRMRYHKLGDEDEQKIRSAILYEDRTRGIKDKCLLGGG